MRNLTILLCLLLMMAGCLKDPKKAKVQPGLKGRDRGQQKPIQEQAEAASVNLLYELADMADQFHLAFLIQHQKEFGCFNVISSSERSNELEYKVRFKKCPLLKGFLNTVKTFSMTKAVGNSPKIYFSSGEITGSDEKFKHPNHRKRTEWTDVRSNFKITHQNDPGSLGETEERFFLDYDVHGEGYILGARAGWESKILGYFVIPVGDPLASFPLFETDGDQPMSLHRNDIQKKRVKGKEETRVSTIKCDATPTSPIKFSVEPCTRPIGTFVISCRRDEKKEKHQIALLATEEGYTIKGNPALIPWVCPTEKPDKK